MLRLRLTLLGLFYHFLSYCQGYWTRVHGDFITPTPSVIGTFAPGNSPMGRYATACMIDSSGMFWLYGGSQANDLWCFDPQINQWKFVNGDYTTTGIAPVYGIQGVASLTNQPGEAGFGHPSWGDNAGNLWLYGLNGLNDLWKYNVSSGMWTWVKGTGTAGPPNYGTQGVAAITNNPGICNETDCHWTDSNGNLWLYTELDGNLWKFDVGSEMWIWIKGNGGTSAAPVYGTMDVYAVANTPGGFSSCPAVGALYTMWVTSDDHLWMMVNRDGASMQLEMWEYNPQINQWRCRRSDSSIFGEPQIFPTACIENDPSVAPIVRTEMRVDWIDDCDRLYFFGGGIFCTMGETYNDIWRYDPVTNCYTYLRGGNDPMVNGVQNIFDPINSPPTAVGGQAWQNDNGFYLLGGQNNMFGTESNAVWLYSPDTVIADFTYNLNCLDVTFVNESTTGCNSFKGLEWDFGDGTFSTDQSPMHTYALNGEYTVKLKATNCSWHTDSMVQVITVNCGFMVNLLADTICAGECINLVAMSSESPDSVSFSWDNGITSDNDTVLVCPSITTTYSVIAINNSGSIDTSWATIFVVDPPLVNLGGDTTLCGGNLLLDAGNAGMNFIWQDGSVDQTYNVMSSGVFFVEVSNGYCSDTDSIAVILNGPLVDLGPDNYTCHPDTILNAGNPGSTYLWQDGSTSQEFVVSSIGNYWVTVTDIDGCQAHDTVAILSGLLLLDLGADTTFCAGDSLTLFSDVLGENYLWSTGDTTPSIEVQIADVYALEVIDGICYAADTMVVNIQNVQAAFEVSDTTGCAPLEVMFTDVSASTGIEFWTWHFGDGQNASQQNVSHEYLNSGVYTVSLQVTTADGCTSDTNKTITVSIYDQPEGQFVFSPNPPEVGTEIQFIDQSTNAMTWFWNFGDGINSEEQNPTHIFHSPDYYTITLIVSNHDCIDSVAIGLVLEEAIVFYVPNVFTPDGDEFNQQFTPVFTSGFDPYDYHLTIFNRWGQVVFESYNANIGWNGSYPRCGLVIDDVYIWQIEFGDTNSDRKFLYRGHVTVLK